MVKSGSQNLFTKCGNDGRGSGEWHDDPEEQSSTHIPLIASGAIGIFRSMQYNTALEKLSDVLDGALSAVRDRKFEVARDRCMQGFALVDLISSDDFGYMSHFHTCKALLDNILSNLPIANKEVTHGPPRLSDSGRSLVSDEDSAAHEDEKFANRTDDEEEDSNTNKGGFRSVIGCEQAKSALLENIVLPMTLAKSTFSEVFQGNPNNHRFHTTPHPIYDATPRNSLWQRKRAAPWPSRYLHFNDRKLWFKHTLYHPNNLPGTGKTMLAQAAATEANAALYSVRPSDVLSKYQGESERYLKGVFRQARTQARAIIFFDGAHTTSHDESRQSH